MLHVLLRRWGYGQPRVTTTPLRKALRTVPAAMAAATSFEYRSAPGELPHPASVGHHSLRCAPHCADGCITNGRRSALNQAGIRCGGWGIQVGPENFIKCTHLSRERSATLISRSNVRPFLGVNQYCRNAGVNQVEIAQGRRGSVGYTRLLRHGTSGECEGEYCDCLSVHGKEE